MQHGVWCNARTHKLICKYCRKEIYYFHCDCGCKVFFDELGEPWPRHYCREYSKQQILATSAKPILHKRLFSWTLISPDEEYQINIEEEYSKRIKRNRIEIELRPNAIENMLAEQNKSILIIGQVREMIMQIDKYKKFKIPENSTFGNTILNKMDKDPYCQITLHSINYSKGNRQSYTFISEQNKIKKENIKLNDTINVDLIGENIGKTLFWFLRSIENISN